jgi:hypothetical protein
LNAGAAENLRQFRAVDRADLWWEGRRDRLGRPAGPETKGAGMADRVLFISWGTVVRGREERALEVFNDILGFCGRAQQGGRIEGIDVTLLAPALGVRGYVAVHGAADQLAALREDEEFVRLMTDAELIVDEFSLVNGYANEGVARQLAIYQEALAKVPQGA